jgi:hypothetical protein
MKFFAAVFVASFSALSGLGAAEAYKSYSLTELGAFPYDSPQSHDLPLDLLVKERKKKPRAAAQMKIPEWIRNLDGSKVAVSGFMVPYDVEDRSVLSFALVKSILICCYGQAPKVNETVLCQMPPGQKTAFLINVPIKVSGKISVGEVKEDGYVVSLYRLSVERIEKIENPDKEMPKTFLPPSGPPRPEGGPKAGLGRDAP